MQLRMGHVIALYNPLAYSRPTLWRGSLRHIASGLLFVCLLAAFSSLICTLLCDVPSDPAVSVSISTSSDARAFLQSLPTPGPESPIKPGSMHCALHHSCSYMGPLLPIVALAPLLVLVTLHLANGLALLQARFGPTPPPPQFVCC